MKKALSLVLALLLSLAALTLGVSAGDLQEGVAVYGTPTIDGKTDEWANVPAYTVDRLKTGTATTITAQFRVMWDESHLYTLVEVKDPDHSFNGGPSVGDGCEVYVDLNNDKSGSFEMDTQAYTAVCANDQSYLSFDGSSVGKSYLEWGTVCAIEETADGYNYEFTMDTVTDFEVALSEGKVIGFDIQVNDQNENAAARTAAYGWCDDTDMAWQSPASYGNITLTKDGSAPAASGAKEIVTPEGVIAHWKFQNNADYVTGSVDDDNLTVKDLTGNGNDLVTCTVGKGDQLDIFSWDAGCDVSNIKADSSLKMDNSKAKSATVDEYSADQTSWTGGYTSGKYFETVETAPMNGMYFEKGWTVEAIFKISPEFSKDYNRYVGILGRQGVVEAQAEAPFLLAIAEPSATDENGLIGTDGYTALQYVKLDSDDLKINTEFGECRADEWLDVIFTSDGDVTEMYINGEDTHMTPDTPYIKVTDPSYSWEVGVGRKPSTGHIGVDCMNEDSPEGIIRRLFCGSISEIKVTSGYMGDVNESMYFGGSGAVEYADYEAPISGAAAPAAEAPAAEAAPAAEGYPSSGYTPKEGSAIINGEIIGLENGWDGTAASGRASAFDGDINTFFDPLGTGDGWCGVDAGGEVTLTAIVIHPRTTFLDRFNGATIEGSMDPEFENAVEIWSSMDAASAIEWQIIDQSDFDEVGSFRYYRYINYTNHGDVGEVELYGYASEGEYEKQEAARQEAAAKAAEEAAAKKAEAEAAKAAEAEAKAAEEAAKAAEEAAAAAAEEAVEAAEGAAETVVEEAKSGCGSVIGGGLIVLLTILGCGWMTSRKH